MRFTHDYTDLVNDWLTSADYTDLVNDWLTEANGRG